MKKTVIALICILFSVSAASLNTSNTKTSDGQSVFEGLLRKNKKWVFEYSVENISSGQILALTKNQFVEKIELGSLVRVQGFLSTMLYSESPDDDAWQFPAQWVICMDINKIEVLEPVNHKSDQDKSLKWAVNLPRIELTSFSRDIGGKYVGEVIRKEDVIEAIVLNNQTSAPIELHIAAISNILEKDPKINSFYEFEPKTKARKYLDVFKNGFFTVIFRTRNNEYIGFELNREKVRIFTAKGDGWFDR